MSEPRQGEAFTLFVSLSDTGGTDFVINPTIAAGDFQVSKDGGALVNLATLPVVAPAASALVKIELSAAEMTADNIAIIGIDAAGAEWEDILISIDNPQANTDAIFDSFYNNATVVIGGGGERTITVKEDDGIANLAVTQVSADGLTRTKQ